MSSTFDVAKARARFPALNQPWVLLDNAGIISSIFPVSRKVLMIDAIAGGSQVLDTVVES
jgi:hypothetical protein